MLKRHRHNLELVSLFALLLAAPVVAEEISATRQHELLHLLKQDCGSCHGLTLQGGLGPALTPQALGDKPKAAMVATILAGRPGTPMPPWGNQLSETEVRWLVDNLYQGIKVMKHVLLSLLLASLTACATLRGTGDMGVVIERATGSIQVIETTHNQSLKRIEGLGDLSHASVVYSRDARFAYVFGRDGGLTKVDLLKGQIAKRIMQSGNSIGGAISQDGRLVAVSNYTPGGVRIFNADTLQLVADIPAVYGDGQQRSKVVGLVDAPDQKFVFSLYDAGEIWLVDVKDPDKPVVTQYKNIGQLPYDALLTPDGRYYIAGLFGEDGLALLDLWHPEQGVQRIMAEYGKGDQKLPVYKMPHLEGWASAGERLFIPAIGHHEVLVIDKNTWQQVKRIPVHGQPVFVMARPDNRQIWINFAHPRNDTVQVLDAESLKVIKTLTPGKAVLHMEFTPRGEQVWISVRDADRVDVYDTRTFERVQSLSMSKPSGIFLSVRAAKIGL